MNKEYIQKAKEEYEFITFDEFEQEIKFKNKYIDEECKSSNKTDIEDHFSDFYYQAKDEIITAIIKSCVDYFYSIRHNDVVLKDKQITAESDALFLTIKFILYSQGFDQCGDRDEEIFRKRYNEEMFYKMLECFCKVLIDIYPEGFQEIKSGVY